MPRSTDGDDTPLVVVHAGENAENSASAATDDVLVSARAGHVTRDAGGWAVRIWPCAWSHVYS